jgi:hypothetical protein
MDLFSTTYFGEIIIFVVSKEQTFRIRCTLMNPEQFLISVPYLLLNVIHGESFKFFDLPRFTFTVKKFLETPLRDHCCDLKGTPRGF